MYDVNNLGGKFKLEEATIASVHLAMEKGLITCGQLIEMYIKRIQDYDKQGPSLNSLIMINPHALKIADELDKQFKESGLTGSLHGIPVLLKDNINTSDMATPGGSSGGTGAGIAANLCENNIIREKYPAISEAADNLASYQIRNRATLVGNICNVSLGADLAAPLLVYDAKIHIASKEGNRVVELNEFFVGVRKTVLKENEIVIGIFVPDVETGDNSIYLRKSRIKGHDLCNVGLAIRLTKEKKLLLAIAAVAETGGTVLPVSHFYGK